MDQNLQFLNAIYQVNKEEKDFVVNQLNNIGVMLNNINNWLYKINFLFVVILIFRRKKDYKHLMMLKI